MPKTVIIVEDQFLIALDLNRRLEMNGWRVMGPAAEKLHRFSTLKAHSNR